MGKGDGTARFSEPIFSKPLLLTTDPTQTPDHLYVVIALNQAFRRMGCIITDSLRLSCCLLCGVSINVTDHSLLCCV